MQDVRIRIRLCLFLCPCLWQNDDYAMEDLRMRIRVCLRNCLCQNDDHTMQDVRLRICLCLCQNDDFAMQDVCIYVIGMLMACPHTSEGQVSEKDHPHPILYPAKPLINGDITNHNLIEIMETVMITRTWDEVCEDPYKDDDSDGGDWGETGFANCHFGQFFFGKVSLLTTFCKSLFPSSFFGN